MHINHLAKGVIKGDSDDVGTKPFRNANHGLGDARFDESLMHAQGSDANTLLIVPQVESLSTQASGINGRHTLTIRGSGFDSGADCVGNKVELAGVPCQIISCSATELKCIVGAVDSTKPSPAQTPLAGSTSSEVWGNGYRIDKSGARSARATNAAQPDTEPFFDGATKAAGWWINSVSAVWLAH